MKAAERRDYQLPFSEEELEKIWQSASLPWAAIPAEVREALQALRRLVAEVRRVRWAACLLEYHHATQGLPCPSCEAYRRRVEAEGQPTAVEA